jgi:transcriptional regulator with XRE-family HTH domain
MRKIVSRDAYLALAKIIEDARRDAGLTQTELGARMGVGQKFISTIELGRRRVDALELLEFERSLGLEKFALLKLVMACRDNRKTQTSTII